VPAREAIHEHTVFHPHVVKPSGFRESYAIDTPAPLSQGFGQAGLGDLNTQRIGFHAWGHENDSMVAQDMVVVKN
jgi:hypothetical protein